MDLTLATFATVVLIAVATPGPTVLLALSNGARFGFGAAIYGMVGAALSDIVLITAVSLGLGVLIATSQVLFALFKWAGVAYLCLLGVKMLRAGDEPVSSASPVGDTLRAAPRTIFLRSFLVAVTNPKGYLFFTAFLPQFINLSEALLPQYLVLAAIFVTIDVAVMIAYALVGTATANTVCAGGQRWIERFCGSAFLALAAGLALYRQNAT